MAWYSYIAVVYGVLVLFWLWALKVNGAWHGSRPGRSYTLVRVGLGPTPEHHSQHEFDRLGLMLGVSWVGRVPVPWLHFMVVGPRGIALKIAAGGLVLGGDTADYSQHRVDPEFKPLAIVRVADDQQRALVRGDFP